MKKYSILLNNRRHLKVSHNQRKQLNSSGYPSCGPRIFESCTRKVHKKSKNYASRRGPIEHLVVFWQTPQGVCKKRNFTLQGGPQVAECLRVGAVVVVASVTSSVTHTMLASDIRRSINERSRRLDWEDHCEDLDEGGPDCFRRQYRMPQQPSTRAAPSVLGVSTGCLSSLRKNLQICCVSNLYATAVSSHAT